LRVCLYKNVVSLWGFFFFMKAIFVMKSKFVYKQRILIRGSGGGGGSPDKRE